MPLRLYRVIDQFNKNSLPFCPEDIGKLSNLIKFCILAFFFICFAFAFDDYFMTHLYSDADGSNNLHTATMTFPMSCVITVSDIWQVLYGKDARWP